MPCSKIKPLASSIASSLSAYIAGYLPLFLPPVQPQAHIPTYLHIYFEIPANIHLLFGILANIHLLGMDSCQHTSTWDCPSFHPFIWRDWLVLTPCLTSLMSELSCRLSYKSTKREKEEFRGAIDILPLRLTSLREALHYQALRFSTKA